jgi:hypothetical protein
MIGQKYKVLPGSGIRTKRHGSCNFNSMYKEMKAVFDEYNYDFIEKEHTTKDLPNGREIVIVWNAEREVDDYAKFEIKVRFFIENLNKKNGNYEGNFEIKIWAHVILDYKNKWQGNPITEFLFKIHNEYIIKSKILNNYEPRLLSDIEKLKGVIKKYLK